MRVIFDGRVRPHSSFARVLTLLEAGATAVGLETVRWDGQEFPQGDFLWSTRALEIPAGPLPVIATIYDLNPLEDGRRGLLAALHRQRLRNRVTRILRDAWRICTCSQHTARRIAGTSGKAENRPHIVPLYADASLSPEPAPTDVVQLQDLGLAPGYVLFLGALRKHKNWERLARAWAQLPQELQDKHPLVLVGRNRRTKKTVAKLAAEGIRPVFLGEVAEGKVQALYRGARLFAFPSLTEGFGLPPLEAMASGTPVLASSRGGLSEVLGEAALFADPESTHSLSEGMARILEDSRLAEGLQQKGLQQAANFGPERTGMAMLELLKP